jgi:hypothetical protein
MSKIVGTVTLADEEMHPPDDHPQYNESALLTLFDHERRQGGYLRVGNRLNEGHAEATLCWFLPDGRALFNFARAPITTNEVFDAGGIRIDTLEAGERMKAVYRGTAALLESPMLLTEGGRALKAAPSVDVTLELDLSGVSPIYGGTPFPGLDVGGHYEQHMKASGSLTVGGETSPVEVWGNRDHSWGPRVWQGTAVDRTLWCTFDESFGFATSLTWKVPGSSEYEVIGYVWRAPELVAITDARVESEFADDDELIHTSMRLELDLEDGTTVEVEGSVAAMAPLRHRRDGSTTHIGWAMAEFRCEGHVGLGLSEYLDAR